MTLYASKESASGISRRWGNAEEVGEASYNNTCITSDKSECGSLLLVCLNQYGNLRKRTKMLMAVEPRISLMGCCCCFQFSTFTASICSIVNTHFMFIIRKRQKTKTKKNEHFKTGRWAFLSRSLGFDGMAHMLPGTCLFLRATLGSVHFIVCCHSLGWQVTC